MEYFRPVTGGADQNEEEGVDCEGVKDGDDGAFRDGNTRSLQLPFRNMWSKNKHQGVLRGYAIINLKKSCMHSKSQ